MKDLNAEDVEMNEDLPKIKKKEPKSQPKLSQELVDYIGKEFDQRAELFTF